MRKFSLIGLGATVLALAVSAPAHAEIGGSWLVKGDVAGKAFVLDCRFEPRGPQFGGVCVEAAGSDANVKAGKVHKLTQGSLNGNQVHWAYQVSVMFMSVDIGFAGMLAGDRIGGTTSAAGRKGTFTAIRK
jgi:hypothetical protein